jgi:lauroyl/myristoyl acyltransferase
VFELMAIAVLAPVAWLLPERLWPRTGHVVSRAIAWLWPSVTRARVATLADALHGRTTVLGLDELRIAILDGYMEERLEILRAHRPGGWRPRLRLIGREHLEAALAAGRGAVLWTAPFSHADLVIKMALAEAGLATSHLSSASRGFSPNACFQRMPSRFGMRVLSPLRTRIEDRWLRERITMPHDGSLTYARQIDRRLRANGLVSIRAGDHGQRAVEVPFLAGSISLATGAPSLALASEAPVLPVFSVQTAPGAYDVLVEAPLADETYAEPRDRHQRVDALARAYARLLEGYVLRRPQDWSGWYTMRLAAPVAAPSVPSALAAAKRAV